MIYTEQQLKELILPMIQSVRTPKDAKACADAIVRVIVEDRQARDGFGRLDELGEKQEFELVDGREFTKGADNAEVS